MTHETEPVGSGPGRSDRLTTFTLIGLLTVQTALLGLLILRVNNLQRLLATGSPGGVAAAGGTQVSAEVIPVDPGDGPVQGSPEAPVTIVEFSCFTCPACADLEPDLKRTLARYPGKVRLAYRYFPLRLDGKPLLLAEAAECARRQGKFWETHDLLFQRSAEIESEPELLETLAPLDLDLEDLSRCLASEEVEAHVRADFEAGRSYGVDSTPTLFVNGRRVRGADFTTLSELVESSLKKEVI
jgi:protein-disulfide isomerase